MHDFNLYLPQSYGRVSDANRVKSCATWYHPATGEGQANDLILLQQGTGRVVSKCRPDWPADILGSDHAPVVYTLLSPTHSAVAEMYNRWQKQPHGPGCHKQRKPGTALRDLDLSDPERRGKYTSNLTELSADTLPGWENTEQLIKAVAKTTLLPRIEQGPDGWNTEPVRKKLRKQLSQQSAVRAKLVSTTDPKQRKTLLETATKARRKVRFAI
jgi:hypothetical protein